MKVFFRAY